MDGTIYTMLSTLAGNLKVRILTSKIPADFGIEGMKFTQQHQSFSLETKKTKDFHDRFIIIDDNASPIPQYYALTFLQDATSIRVGPEASQSE